MADELSEIALAHLETLANGPGTLPDLPELEILWDQRYVMGSKTRAHITSKGKAVITKVMKS